jgi:microcystin degradation protein MlrC
MSFMKKHLFHLQGIHLARPWRVGMLGLVHETNTFESGCTGYSAFAQPADREPLMRGAELLALRGTRSVMGGMLRQIDALARPEQVELVPLYRASAAPSAMVERAAWRQLREEILAQVEQAGPLDALLVELHGAMVAEGEDDCEGALLAALRERVGGRCVIVASLDFHANVSPEMVEHTDVLVPYRTYPHVDMYETGERCACRLLALLAAGQRPVRAWRQAPFLVPLVGQYTGDGPMADFMQACRQRAQRDALDMALCGGFALADTPHAGPSLVVYAAPGNEARAQAAAQDLMALLNTLRVQFAQPLQAPQQAVAMLRAGERTILADVADNPGAGCSAQNMALLTALHDAAVERSLVATLNLPDWAAAAHAAGPGRGCTVAMPGRTQPVQLRVLALSDGHYACTGAMWHGREVRQGLTARVAWDGIEAIVSSAPVQALDPGALACVGTALDAYDVVSLKSSVHYRAAFGPWAQRIVNVDAHRLPGQSPAALDYRRLRPGVAALP